MSVSTRSIERFRHEYKFRIAVVDATERITPKMMRVTLRSPELQGFRSDGFDDHVRLFFPPRGSALSPPAFGESRLVFPDNAARPVGRDYTPRRFGADRLVIDFVLHGDGPASNWADAAVPGDKIGIGGPRTSFVVRGDFDWHLLIGDETALPAIGRRIEELPQGSHALAFVEIANRGERQSFPTPADVDIVWVERDRAGADTRTPLLDRVKAAVLPSGTGCVFVACEDTQARALRKHLVEDRGLNPSFIKAYRFWLRGAPDLGQ
jgi:NADPH-dependent ferric siderophore reductase